MDTVKQASFQQSAQGSSLAAVLRVDCRGQGGRWRTHDWTLTAARGEAMVPWARDVIRGGQILGSSSIFLRKKKKQISLASWDLPKWA